MPNICSTYSTVELVPKGSSKRRINAATEISGAYAEGMRNIRDGFTSSSITINQSTDRTTAMGVS